MPMIFPGMDPYLEAPSIFPGIHGRMVVYLADQLAGRIRPRYVASVGERVYVQSQSRGSSHAIIPDVWMRRVREDPLANNAGGVAVVQATELDEPAVVDAPDLEIHQPFVEIIDRESNMRVVTVIELVSPANKYAGPGRESYVMKQQEVINSDAHLVEIDLLRRGPYVVAAQEASVAGQFDYDYLICVHRAHTRKYEVYPRSLQQPLPRIRVPLAGDDPDVRLDIRAALAQAYDAGSYDVRIDYAQPCRPPLNPSNQKWVDELVAATKTGM